MEDKTHLKEVKNLAGAERLDKKVRRQLKRLDTRVKRQDKKMFLLHLGKVKKLGIVWVKK